MASVVAPLRASEPSSDTLIRSISREAVLSYLVACPREVSANEGASSLGVAAYLIERAHEFGLLSQTKARVRGWLDLSGSISQLWDYPHALVLLDIQASPRVDSGHQLSGLRAALIIHTKGVNTRIEQRVQHLLSSYTNDQNSDLSHRQWDGGTVFTLRDRRLPEWAELSWGPCRDAYIVAIGEGSFERVAQTMAGGGSSLADDGWFANAWEKAGGRRAFLACTVRLDLVRAAVDGKLQSKIQRAQESLELDGVDRALWTVGRRGRALEAGEFFKRNENDEGRSLTRADDSALLQGVIPEEASWYSVLDIDPQSLIRTLSRTYLVSRSPRAQEKSRTFWRDVEQRVGLSIDEDILGHLRRPVVSHDYPRHVLELPFCWTRLIAVQDSDTLRRNLDRVLEAARNGLAQEGSVRLHRDQDGVWFLYFGIAGPALAVTDHWLVISHSPDAVRKNMELLTRQTVSSARD